MRNDIKKYILFVVFTAASFLTLLGLSLYQHAISAEFGRYYWLGESTIMLVLWLPYAIMAASGVFAACALFIGGENRKESAVLGILSLIGGLAVLVFTVMSLFLFFDMVTAFRGSYWSTSGARPSMVIMGALLANAVRHFIAASKYKKQENNENKENKEKQEKAEETEEQQIADE